MKTFAFALFAFCAPLLASSYSLNDYHNALNQNKPFVPSASSSTARQASVAPNTRTASTTPYTHPFLNQPTFSASKLADNWDPSAPKSSKKTPLNFRAKQVSVKESHRGGDSHNLIPANKSSQWMPGSQPKDTVRDREARINFM